MQKLVKLKNNIRLWKIYKPPRIICTNKDPQKRKTIFDILPNDFPRVISIGRLDFMSEGLLGEVSDILTQAAIFAIRSGLESITLELLEKIDLLYLGIQLIV